MKIIRTPVSWVGNKTSILPILYAMFPTKYKKYIEPFGGSGAVLLGKKKPDKFEVYNDYNNNLVNLFRVMKSRTLAFIRKLGFLHLNSRDDFIVYKKFISEEKFDDKYFEQEMKLTEIMFDPPQAKEIRKIMRKNKRSYSLRRAVAYLKLLRFSYSSGGKSYGARPFDIRKLFCLIQKLQDRLANAVIENQDFEVLIKHYDSNESFFYCDPPYYTSEYVYACGFTWEDHKRLAKALLNMKGLFLLSYNDCPEIRELYKGCYFFDFKRVHSMRQKYEAGSEFPELLIANYDLTKRVREAPMQLSLFENEQEKIDIKKMIMEGVVQ